MKIRGKWNGYNFEYNNGVISKYRIEIREIISYKLGGINRYRIEYYDGEVEDVDGEHFTDGAFISEMVKLGKFEVHHSHNGGFTVYRGYEYDYLRDKVLQKSSQ